VDAYIHGGGRIGVLVEVNCETDFVANTAEFRSFVHDIAMQIAAANPRYVAKEDVPSDVLEKEKEILRQQAINEGKPENILDKIIEGRIDKFYKEVCLLEQPFIRDTDRAVKDLVMEQITKFGENINIRRFTRYEMGEGLEKVASC
jgi:elongation factor Ts